MAEPSNFHDLHRRLFPMAARAEETTGQAINTDTNVVIIWNSEIFDINGLYNPATGIYTTSKQGIYYVSAMVQLAATAQLACGELFRLWVAVDSVRYAYLGFHDAWACGATSITPTLNGSTLIHAAAGAAIKFTCRQNSGANLALSGDGQFNHMSIARIGPGIA